MQTVLLVHILAGGVALASGYVALFAAKGATVHRRSGMLFVYTMLTMSLLGVVMSVGHTWQVVNIPAGLLTAYLVLTALATVRPPARGARALIGVAMGLAFLVGAIELVLGLQAVGRGGSRNGVPAFPFLLFAVIGLCASVGDLRLLRAGGIHGASRLARHLWRMCLALLIAAMSFFLGQSDEFPKALRQPALLALPVLVVLVTMLYWLWRTLRRRSGSGPKRDRAIEPGTDPAVSGSEQVM